MIINIISKQYNRDKITGPGKVLTNTIKGLDVIGVDYVFNQPISKYQYNWIHDDARAVIEASLVGKSVVLGPNIVVLLKEFPIFRKKIPSGSIYLQPSIWPINLWKFLGFNECKLDYWPVGIDTNEFTISTQRKNKVLVYFKKRNPELLEQAKKVLIKLELSYDVIIYGDYKEETYKQALQECCFGIWIGHHESQGIGLQEALATNLPLIVLDATSLFDTFNESYKFPKYLVNIKTSSAPYFDKRCGIKILSINELENAIIMMQNNLKNYQPREYVLENLSLEYSAKRLVSFFDVIKNTDTNSFNYQKLSYILYYFGLFFKKSTWRIVVKKLFKN